MKPDTQVKMALLFAAGGAAVLAILLAIALRVIPVHITGISG